MTICSTTSQTIIVNHTTDILLKFREVAEQTSYPKIVQFALSKFNNMFESDYRSQLPVSEIYKHNSLTRSRRFSPLISFDCRSLVWLAGTIVFAVLQLVQVSRGSHSQATLTKLKKEVETRKLLWDAISTHYKETSNIRLMMTEAFEITARLTSIRQPKIELGYYFKIFMCVSAIIGTIGVINHSKVLSIVGFSSCGISALFSLTLYGKSGALAFEESQLSDELDRLVDEMGEIIKRDITAHLVELN